MPLSAYFVDLFIDLYWRHTDLLLSIKEILSFYNQEPSNTKGNTIRYFYEQTVQLTDDGVEF